LVAKLKKYPTNQKTRGGRWAVKVLMALAVLVIVGGFFYLRSGFEVLIGSKVATKGGVIRRETRPTLSPARFVGQAARAHEIAQEIPDVLDQLSCYCQCERHLAHKSLLSCYTDGHAGT
jgi:hypothetical protein